MQTGMLKLRIISFFLAVTMAITMLPLSQIGYALGSNQWTEELPHECSQPDKADSFPLTTSFLPADGYSIVSHISENNAMIYIHHSASIPSNHSTDVVSPPPDVLG